MAAKGKSFKDMLADRRRMIDEATGYAEEPKPKKKEAGVKKAPDKKKKK